MSSVSREAFECAAGTLRGKEIEECAASIPEAQELAIALYILSRRRSFRVRQLLLCMAMHYAKEADRLSALMDSLQIQHSPANFTTPIKSRSSSSNRKLADRSDAEEIIETTPRRRITFPTVQEQREHIVNGINAKRGRSNAGSTNSFSVRATIPLHTEHYRYDEVIGTMVRKGKRVCTEPLRFGQIY